MSIRSDKIFNRVTNVGLGIAFIGLGAGFLGIPLGIAGYLIKSATLGDSLYVGLFSMWGLVLTGILVATFGAMRALL